MSDPKEPCGFCSRRELTKIWPEMARQGYCDNFDKYLGLFSNAGEARVVGESSTNYSKEPAITGVASRIASFNPGARILYSVRDPVDRTISHYWHLVKTGRETRTIERAIRENPEYLHVSDYSMQVRKYMDVFPLEQIKIVTLEELENDARGVIVDILTWLGVDPNFEPSDIEKRFHVTEDVVLRFRFRFLATILRRFPVRDALRPVFPEKGRLSLKKFFFEEVRRHEVSVEGVLEDLLELREHQARELSSLFGRDFREWEGSKESTGRVSQIGASHRPT
jgi:hypothetical protein